MENTECIQYLVVSLATCTFLFGQIQHCMSQNACVNKKSSGISLATCFCQTHLEKILNSVPVMYMQFCFSQYAAYVDMFEMLTVLFCLFFNPRRRMTRHFRSSRCACCRTGVIPITPACIASESTANLTLSKAPLYSTISPFMYIQETLGL